MDAFHPITVAEKSSLRLCVERQEVADACRKALVAFFADVAPSGSARALAAWLVGPYASAVLPTTRFDFPAGKVDRGRLTDVIDDARAQVGFTMRSLASTEVGMHFSMHAATSGWVVQFSDVRAQAGFMPIDLPKMRLIDRVLSLMAADYMARAESYTRDLHVCDTCDVPDFHEHTGERGCRLCDRASGIEFKAAPHSETKAKPSNNVSPIRRRVA
jgi:hypothetical protein